MRAIRRDMRDLRPSLVPAVPRVLNRMYAEATGTAARRLLGEAASMGHCTDHPDLASAVADQPGAGGQGGAAVPGHGGQQQGGAGQQAALQQDQAPDGWVRVDIDIELK